MTLSSSNMCDVAVMTCIYFSKRGIFFHRRVNFFPRIHPKIPEAVLKPTPSIWERDFWPAAAAEMGLRIGVGFDLKMSCSFGCEAPLICRRSAMTSMVLAAIGAGSTVRFITYLLRLPCSSTSSKVSSHENDSHLARSPNLTSFLFFSPA